MPRSRSPVWLSLPGHRLLKGRAGHTATLVGKKLFVIGGRNGSEFFDDLWEFDIQLNQWKLLQKHTPVTARAYHTTTLIQGNQLWVIGGSDLLTMYGDVHVLNTDTLEWTSPVTKGQLAGKLRGTHAAIQHPVQAKGILVFGGYGGPDSQWLHDLAILRTDTLLWEELYPKGVAPSGRGYHTLTAFGIHVVLFGGKGDTGIISSNEISVYDAMMDTWITPRLRGETPISRANHAAVLIKDDLIVIYGGRNGSDRLSDLCLLQILSSPVAGSVDSFAWQVIEQEKPKVQKKAKPVKSQNPGGRSAHTLVANDSSIYLFGGYGGNGTMTGAASKTAQKTFTLGRRLQIETDDAEGWRSTKRARQLSHLSGKTPPAADLHILDSDDETGNYTSSEVPVHVNDRQRSNKAVANSHPQTSVRVEKGQMAKTDALSNLYDTTRSKTTLEKDHGKELPSLQQVVDSLKAEVNGLKTEVNGKNLLESELRAGKAALEQNIQLLHKQVEEGNQKALGYKCEIEQSKLDAQGLIAQVNEKEKERCEAVQKMRNAEHKLEECSRSLEQLKTQYCEASQELDSCKLKAQKRQMELGKQTADMNQMRDTYEKETTYLNKNVQDKNDMLERLSKELEVSKDSARALQDTVERLAKHVEHDNSKIDVLEKEKERLTLENAKLSAERVKLIGARDGAEATVELVKEEVRVARGVIERNAVEISQMRENADLAKEHIASLHVSVKKNEVELKSTLEENEKLRRLLKEIEDFENAHVRSIQNHVEKIRCARQFGPQS